MDGRLRRKAAFVLAAYALCGGGMGLDKRHEAEAQEQRRSTTRKSQAAASREKSHPESTRQVALDQPRQVQVIPPAADWQLDPADEARLDQVLIPWQQKSAAIKTLAARFKKVEYKVIFNGNPDKPTHIGDGKVAYARPDKGLFRVEDAEDAAGEHWVCTGKSVFQFDHDLKRLVEYPLPPDMRGRAIADGPLPFLFGVEAEAMKSRYFMRVITPSDIKDEIWIEAYPRTRQDAVNYQQVDLILSAKTLLPAAIQIFDPNGKDRTVYTFSDIETNSAGQAFKELLNVFIEPRTPLGWKKVVEEMPSGAQPAAPPRVGSSKLRDRSTDKR